jgi:iron complex transport system permease protein
MKRTPLLFLFTAIILILSVLLGLMIGAVKIPVASIFEIFTGRFGGEEPWRTILLDLRLPRVILAILVGFGLSSSGAVVQAIFRNPLAEPYLLGISGGGAFGATLFSLLKVKGLNIESSIGLPAFSFLFALLAVFLVYWIARFEKTVPVERLLLAGIALSFLFASFTALFIYLSIVYRPQVIFWLLGGFSRARWGLLYSFGPILFLGSVSFFFFWRELNGFLLGEEEAHAVGISVETVKRFLLIIVALVTGAAVGSAGIVGFVGLMVPHISRRLVGGDYRLLLPHTILLGGAMLVLCDLLSRVILSPSELPVGIITSLLGVPFFIWLLRREIHRNV